MTFTESNTVEQMILDSVVQKRSGKPKAGENMPGWGTSLGNELIPARWDYLPAAKLPRQSGDVMVEPWVREALVRLNPEITIQPDRADEVIYNLRAVVNHIVQHFRTKVEPGGFKAQVVVFDRECCVLYKTIMDDLVGVDASAIVMTAAQGDPFDKAYGYIRQYY